MYSLDSIRSTWLSFWPDLEPLLGRLKSHFSQWSQGDLIEPHGCFALYFWSQCSAEARIVAQKYNLPLGTLTVSKAAAQLGRSPRAVQQMAKDGRLVATKGPRGRWFVWVGSMPPQQRSLDVVVQEQAVEIKPELDAEIDSLVSRVRALRDESLRLSAQRLLATRLRRALDFGAGDIELAAIDMGLSHETATQLVEELGLQDLVITADLNHFPEWMTSRDVAEHLDLSSTTGQPHYQAVCELVRILGLRSRGMAQDEPVMRRGKPVTRVKVHRSALHLMKRWLSIYSKPSGFSIGSFVLRPGT